MTVLDPWFAVGLAILLCGMVGLLNNYRLAGFIAFILGGVIMWSVL